jgi:hypothetical protein
MASELGPVQLIVFGFDRPKFEGGITAELRRLHQSGIVRVLDALVLHKTADGDIRIIEVANLNPNEDEKQGAVLGAMVGVIHVEDNNDSPDATMGGEDGEPAGETWDVLESIPSDSAAALVLLEHCWAIPLRKEIREEGGAAIGDLWLHPQDLMAVGLIQPGGTSPQMTEAA